MNFDTIAELNYHLDHEIAQAFGFTLEEVDALPLPVLEELRSAQVQVEESRKTEPSKWAVKELKRYRANSPKSWILNLEARKPGKN